jgi:anaerobic magnesium-protoporphyrin IX monomethyl ester cyclase
MRETEKTKVLLFFPMLLKNQNPLLVPLELISLSPSLKRLGLDVRILDDRIEKWSPETLKKELENVLFVGTSSRPGGQVPRSFEFAKAVKSVRPDLPVVMGGWFPTIVPERVAAHPAVDYVITGEGEFVVDQFARELLNGHLPAGIPGLAYFRDNLFHCIPHQKISRITETSFPDYEALDIEKYLGENRELSYISSKGCNGTCKFCAIHCGYEDQWYALPASRVIEEITYLVRKYNVKRLRFVDANFFADEERVSRIMEGFIREKLEFLWQAPGRADQLLEYKDETWRLLQKAGCRRIEAGAESGSVKILKEMDKGITPDHIDEFSRRANSFGISGIYNFILGFPDETLDQMRETTQFIHKIKRQFPESVFAIYRFSPIPITELYAPLQGVPPGKNDPELVEQFKIYRETPDQPWLQHDVSRITDMLFYFYLPFSLRSTNSSGNPLLRAAKNLFIKSARYRVDRFNFRFPFEWWILRLGTRFGIFNPQRFRQWAQS